MNILEKIKSSWWVLLSFIISLNGLGFLYIGFKYNNRNWVLEGITYEFPWFFFIILYAIYRLGIQTTIAISLAVILMFVSVIRSVWVAIKLVDVYENNEKYTIKQTNLNNSSNNQDKEKSPFNFSCCICLVCIFFIMAVIAIF